MADEMDESLGAEEKDAKSKESAEEGVKASSPDGKVDETRGVEAASRQIADDGSIAAGESASSASGQTVEATYATADHSTKTLYEAAPSVDQSAPQKTYAAFGGAASRQDGAARVDGGELDKPGLDLLYDVELDATLQFGSKEMLLRDVLELGPGDVVELDRHIAQPVDLVVGDRIVARGEVVVASGNFALRVTEVATPQMRLESIRCLF